MLRCWDADPAERPLFCELSSTVAMIIAKMTAAAAETGERRASETDSGFPPAGYVNAPVADYLRPIADRTIAQPAEHDRRLDSSDSAAEAAETRCVDDDGVEDFNSDVRSSDDT